MPKATPPKTDIVQQLKRIAADSAYRDYLARNSMKLLIDDANERLLPIGQDAGRNR